jgi:hypothetical protein
LFTSVLIGNVGDALDILIGTLCELAKENDGAKSAKDTICGPLGVTALPCRGFGGRGFGLLFLWLS